MCIICESDGNTLGTTLMCKWSTINFCVFCVPILKWKALKCQTLGTAAHVIVLVCWLEIHHCLVTLSCLPCTLFHSCPCKVRSRVSDTLSQALCNLSLAFLAPWWQCSTLLSENLHTNQEFIAGRVCNSHMVSIPTIWIGWHSNQQWICLAGMYLTWSHSRC